MRSYDCRFVVEEDELSFDMPPEEQSKTTWHGGVTRWLGGFQWLVTSAFSFSANHPIQALPHG